MRTLVIGLVLWSFSALAQVRPWAEGVSPDRQELALKLYREGNEFFEQSKHAQALTKYREALKSWDHPAIRFNTTVALINLDQPLDALDNLDAAMRFNEQPFDAETWKQAQLYRKLLGGQVADLRVACDLPGAQVSLDGDQLFVAPGSAQRRVRPGSHQVVAAKAGYTTSVVSLQLDPGKQLTHQVSLVEEKAQLKLVQRFPGWLPWTVMGTGLALGVAGAPLMASANGKNVAFDRDLARLCPSGCATSVLPDAVVATRSSARTENVAAIVLFSTGVATLATGIALAILNIPQPESVAFGITPNGLGFNARF